MELSFSGIKFLHIYIKCLPLHTSKKEKMKKDIHPKQYRLVVFKDISCDYAFMSRSTVETKDTITWEDGKEYPLVKLELSHMSHPYYTGKMKLVDTAGRVDKFNSRYAKRKTGKKEQE